MNWVGWLRCVCLLALLVPGVATADDAATAMRSVVSVLPQWPGKPPNADEPEGSGVVAGNGRHIITANHVIGQAQRILVRTSDGRIVAARILGRDKATDLAVLEIDEALVPLAFGGVPVIGSPVCAIGNSFGLGLSLTCGTVSAINRSNAGFNAIEDFVQTDAAVNPGASGGALVTADGRLVGILSAIFTKTSDANIGINFAVSALLVERVYASLKTGEAIVWRLGGLGLRKAPGRGETGRQGALVVSVRAGSSGERAGLARGDVIINAASRRVRGPGGFRAAMARLALKARMTIRFLRNDTEMTTELVND